MAQIVVTRLPAPTNQIIYRLSDTNFHFAQRGKAQIIHRRPITEWNYLC